VEFQPSNPFNVADEWTNSLLGLVDYPGERQPEQAAQAMIEIGMKPMEATLSATRDIAAGYHKLDQLGTLEKGKIADLVVVDADPLQDINNLPKISLVMKEGQVVDRDKLPLKKILSVSRTTSQQ
jgi:imidazolonepropionase-like amidohydrolase